ILALPWWEPYLELLFSSFVFVWVSFLLFLIVFSHLKSVIRALLCTKTISMLVVEIGQLLISAWCIHESSTIGTTEFHFFAPIMVYQSGYYMCACTILLITIERLLLCFKPCPYDRHDISFKAAFSVSLIIEMLMVFSVVVLMQYESLRLVCASFIGVQEWITFSVKGVIELTKALIPIISSALCVKMLLLILTIISDKFENFAADAHLFLRVACTTYSIFMPFLLIFQVKTLKRRFTSFFPSCNKPDIIYAREMGDAEAATEKYFPPCRAHSLNHSSL
ncbi:hypothetical protein PENTCL1PPCAC_16754, partial [Pristionchus entomophagus]